MNEKLLSAEVQKFIKDHQHDDPFLLSLNTKKNPDFPLEEAIEQIQSRQKAKGKLRRWLAKEGIIFPPPISIEQSSSERTAKFKASIIHGNSIVDLTGGMGIDASSFADIFSGVKYVESNKHLCQLARHNFKVLEQDIEVHEMTAEHFLSKNKEQFDVVYIDPSRRVDDKKVFKLEDCVPNLYEILPACLKQSKQVLVKLSPLVDLSLLIQDFDASDVWVLAVRGEVKEVLCVIKQVENVVKIHAVDLMNGETSRVFEYDWMEEEFSENEYSKPLKYIYEPNAAIMKAGAFKLVGKKFRLKKLHQHSHLYTSNELINEFPGKKLQIIKELKQNKKELQKAAPGKKINVITRNFSVTATQLKKKFRLKDGGDQYLIGTTLMDGSKVLLLCKRLK